MEKGYGILVICAMILVLSLVGTVSATNWSVDDSGEADFIGIQDAINNASDGDTILVHSGVYYENVVVDKSVTLKGIGNPIVDASGEGSAITLIAGGITLEGFNATNAGNSLRDAGIVVTSNDNSIAGNNVSNNSFGIYLGSYRNNIITGNNANNNYCGIRLSSSSNNNTIIGNNLSNNWYGISLSSSSNNNTITGNNLSNNWGGIVLSHSRNSTITGNIFVNTGLKVEFSYQNTEEDNTVNGKPLVYLEDASNYTVEDAGQVILVNCTNVTVQNLDLSNTTAGIVLEKTEDSKFLNNTVSNTGDGIHLLSSGNNTVIGNNVSNNERSISLSASHDNTIIGNNVSNNEYGISLSNSRNNSITGNNISNINAGGLSLKGSCNNAITSNNVCNNGKGISLDLFSDNNAITSNNVCNNNDDGIYLFGSRDNRITGNNVSNNGKGIHFDTMSSRNEIYLNNFINNIDNACSDEFNLWNSPVEITYIYNGTTYESYLGNYWSDYKEKYPGAREIDSTGIWDTPYSIDEQGDKYPLMEPFENYILPRSAHT